jgi:D-alanyl-D-alanine carboxypeptidase
MRRVASEFGFRAAVLGTVAVFAALALTATPADARRARGKAVHHRAAKTAKYSPPYSAIVVDANSGKTLHESSPDSPRHPASLTKIMTLYLLFEQLEDGKLTLRSDLNVSPHASAQAPSKLGLKPGDKIAVDDAIRALVTKSANDVAVVVAETLADSEASFARLMTRKARALGMEHTLYRNASGLPNDEQITTARDQALLGRAIQDRFPKYYRYFSTPSFSYKGHEMRNHNKLLGSVPGIDGIKTGFVEASGFNLVASLRRNNRHLVAVVMGGRSGGSRDARMRELLSQHVEVASIKRTAPVIAEAPESALTMPLRATAAGAGSMAPVTVAAIAPPTAEAATPADLSPTATVDAAGGSGGDIEPIRVKTVKVKAGMLPTMAISAATSHQRQPPAAARPEPQVTATIETRKVADETKAPAPVQLALIKGSDSPAARGSEWMIQVGALETQKDANERIASARAKAPKFLSRAKAFTEPIIKAEMKLYRARFSGISRTDAEAACKELKNAKIVCIALKN